MKTSKPLFSVIILTLNEEKNIKDCLNSLNGLNANIYIVDSGSTDCTLEICRLYTSNIYNHKFDNYGAQRNWALQALPLDTDWVINLDADHRLTPGLVNELNTVIVDPENKDIKGFLTSRKTYFLGKWIRYGGHYPTYHANIFRRGYGSCEDKLYDQHFKVTGETKVLNNDIIDVITDSINSFITRHNKWAGLEADFQMSLSIAAYEDGIKPRLFGNKIEQRRYIKSVYEKFPLFVRPVIYFLIRYFFRLGFLDGRRGLIFHFLQGFWFRFLVDARIYELKHNKGK